MIDRILGIVLGIVTMFVVWELFDASLTEGIITYFVVTIHYRQRVGTEP